MESIRDRFSGRDRMGSDRGGRDRYDRMDRGDMGERSPRRGQSYGSDGAQIDEIANVIEQSNSKQLEVFADCIDDVKDEVFASGKEIMKALDQISASGASGRASRVQEASAPQIDPAMKEEILKAVSNNTELLYAIQEMLKKEAEEKAKAEAPAPEENAGADQAEKTANPIKEMLTQYYNNMEEHVHKENVKCYRNVQAALSEQGTQVVEQSKKSLILIKVFVIISVVLGITNGALFLGYIFGYI